MFILEEFFEVCDYIEGLEKGTFFEEYKRLFLLENNQELLVGQKVGFVDLDLIMYNVIDSAIDWDQSTLDWSRADSLYELKLESLDIEDEKVVDALTNEVFAVCYPDAQILRAKTSSDLALPTFNTIKEKI